MGASWGADDAIVYSNIKGIMSISANGREPELLHWAGVPLDILRFFRTGIICSFQQEVLARLWCNSLIQRNANHCSQEPRHGMSRQDTSFIPPTTYFSLFRLISN